MAREKYWEVSALKICRIIADSPYTQSAIGNKVEGLSPQVLNLFCNGDQMNMRHSIAQNLADFLVAP